MSGPYRSNGEARMHIEEIKNRGGTNIRVRKVTARHEGKRHLAQHWVDYDIVKPEKKKQPGKTRSG